MAYLRSVVHVAQAALLAHVASSPAEMLALLRSWPADLYRAKVVLASVQAAGADADAAPTDASSGALAHFARLECEAVLLCGVGAPERALDILLRLPSASVDVFAFVEQHKLHGFLRDKAR